MWILGIRCEIFADFDHFSNAFYFHLCRTTFSTLRSFHFAVHLMPNLAFKLTLCEM